jgi:hypothetical protein
MTCDGRHNFIWTPLWSVVYFLKSVSNLLSNFLESPPYLFGVNRNPRFTTESFSSTVLRHPNLAQRAVESKTGCVLGLKHDPSTLVVILPLLYNL